MKLKLNWKGKVALLLISLFALFAFTALAQTPPTAPAAAAPAIAAPAAVSPTGLAAWVKNTGGLVSAVGVVVIVLNGLFSFLAFAFTKLAFAEPVWMQTIGGVLLKLTQWFSANTATPAPMVQASLDAQKPPATSG